MPIHGCSSGALATAVFAILLLPAPFYVPDFYSGVTKEIIENSSHKTTEQNWLESFLEHFPPLDLFVTFSLIMLALVTYLCEWVQRKILERRIIKLNQYLVTSVERLRAWDTQQEQLEGTLKMVQNATSEYNLLLYLLLRQHRCLTQSPSTFLDKEMDGDIAFLRGPPLDA